MENSVNWSEPEREACLPDPRELDLHIAKQRLRQAVAEVKGLHSRLQAILCLLDLEGGADGPEEA